MKTTKLVVGRRSLMIAFYRGKKRKRPQSWELTSSLGSSIIVMGCVHFCELFVTPNLCVVCVLLQLL
jgi:hypothetical protein